MFAEDGLLSSATKEALRPLRIAPRDHFYLEIVDDKRGKTIKFKMTVLGLTREVADDTDHELIVKGHDGTRFAKTYNGPSQEALKIFQFIPECRSEATASGAGDNIAVLGMTDFTAISLSRIIPSDRIIFKDDDSQTAFRYLIRRFFAQTARANMTASFKINGIVPEMPADYVPHPQWPLSDYQKTALMFALGQESTALFMDRGTGKTAVTINRVCLEAQRHHQKTGKMLRVLVVTPNQVRLNWQEEFKKFSTVPGKTTIIRGGQMKRIRLLTHIVSSDEKSIFSIGIIGYDTMAVTIEYLKKIQWDLIVCDESHYFKWHRTKRYEALRELRDVSGKRMVLTGTPIGNSIFDLWTQFEFQAEGMSGFQSFESFRRFHGRWKMIDNAHGVEKLVGLQNVPLLQERLARTAFSITKKEAGLNLPDKVYDIYEVEMTKKQAHVYDSIASQLAVEIEADLEAAEAEGTKNLAVNHALTKLLRLAQITSGFVKWDMSVGPDEALLPARVEQIDSINPKIEAVVEMLNDEERDPRGKTIIWCCFHEDIEAVSRKLTELGIKHGKYYGKTSQAERDAHVDAFNNDPEFRVFIANPATAGEGLNLLGYNPTKPDESNTFCDHEIFFSQNWSMIQRVQAEDRAHRRGTRTQVRITDLMVPGTIDQEIRDRVTAKLNSANAVQDVREILQRVLRDYVSNGVED